MKPKKPKYVPPKKGIKREPRKTITETEYHEMIRKGKKIPRGTKVITGKPQQKKPEELGIIFRSDGSIEIPVYAGKEGQIQKARVLKPKTIPEGVRLVFHQIESVQSRLGQAQQIFELISRLQWDLNYKWNKFNSAQKKAFTEYFAGVSGQLTKNPVLLTEENKINAIKRIEKAKELLEKGNASAALASMRGIKNDLLDWTRKMKFQTKYLKRRKKIVIDKKFEKDTTIFSAIDSLRSIFSELGKPDAGKKRNTIAAKIRAASKKFYLTGLKAFRQSAIITGKAAELAEKGEIQKAREYIRTANKKAVTEASSISSVYPDKLREIMQSKDHAFKEKVLSNQAELYYDMISYWWPKKGNTAKRKLIFDSVKELSGIAASTGKELEASMISDAAKKLEKNDLAGFSDLMLATAIKLNPSLTKEII